MKRVRVKMLPKAQSGVNFTMPGNSHPAHMGSRLTEDAFRGTNHQQKEDVKVNKHLKPVEREHATLEAEKGETVVTNLGKGGIPEFYIIGGKRHHSGGTPLNLPSDSFVFSRDRKLKIKDKDVLAQFGKNVGKKGKKGFTPAELSKKYNLNTYLEILNDPDSDRIQRETAEMMITNYNMKLGALSLVQESMKGFPEGLPAIAMPYMEYAGIRPEELVQIPQMQMGGAVPPQQRYGGAPNAQAIKKIEPSSNVTYRQFGGGVGTPDLRKVRVTMPKYQGGGQSPAGTVVLGPDGRPLNMGQGTPTGGSPSTGRSTRSQNIPKDAVKWDMTADGYDETQIQPGDYVKKSDGKWYKVTGYKASPYTGDFADERLAGEHGDLQEAYGRLQQTLTDDPELRKAFIANYRKAIAEAKPNSRTKLSQADLDAARALTDDQVIDNFLQMQMQVMSVNANLGDMSGVDPEDQWDKKRDNYYNTARDLGFEPLDVAHTAAFQAAYVGLQNLKDNPDYKEALEDFAVGSAQVGLADEPGGGTGRATISDIDGWVGNTTIGQSALYKPVTKDLEMAEADWTERKEQEIKHLAGVAPEEPAPWWLQDKIKVMGAAMDMARIKKYMPWQATPGMDLATPTFKDPLTALHQNQALANIATQGAGMFAGPQALAARSAQIQGKAAQNAANIIAGVHDRNVDIANQFEMVNTNIFNQHSDRKSQLATQLYDKNIIANQQFDNAKAQGRQQLRQSLVDAVTNRAQTQAMNTLYEQYSVDPRTGGMLHHTGVNRPITPTKPTTGITDRAIAIQQQNAGMDYDQALKYAKAEAGIPDSPVNNQLNASQFAYPGTYQG